MEQVKGQQPIAILMATYNGERYIREQLDSIMRQSFSSWQLFVHDDGSTDQTPAILRSYAREHDNMTLLEYESQRGAAANFLSLLQRVEADYYMFADQDDVWHEKKIETSWMEMIRQEHHHPDKPLIVYSDLYVTDEKLNITHASFWQLSDIHPQIITKFCHLAALSPVTGCTLLFNKKAKESVVYPIYHNEIHDSWITACVLRNGGLIHPIPQQLTYYRQHGDNSIGAIDFSHITLSYRFRHLRKMASLNKHHYQMLQSLGYGPVFKYLFYKLAYKIRKNQTRQ